MENTPTKTKPDIHPGFILEWKGLKWLAFNRDTMPLAVTTFADVPEIGHDALLCFFWSGKMWEFRLSQSRHRPDVNVGKIAKSFHAGVGEPENGRFAIAQIPFPLYAQP